MSLAHDICWRYATLLCAARIIEHRFAMVEFLAPPARGEILDAAKAVYDRAPATLWPGLDAIKRVLEIDTELDNPVIAIMRAGMRTGGADT